MTEQTQKYARTETVCKMLSISRSTLLRWEQKGIFKSFRIGNIILWDIEAITNYIDTQLGA